METTVYTPAGIFTISAPVTNQWGTRCVVTQNGSLVASLEKVGQYWYGRVEFAATASIRQNLGFHAGDSPEALITGAVDRWLDRFVNR